MVTLVNLLAASSNGLRGECSPLVSGRLDDVSSFAMVYRWAFGKWERWKLCCRLIFAVVVIVGVGDL